jgi:phage terminase large subunit-like protein
MNATSREHLKARRIHRTANPILRRHASNAVARGDAAANIKLDKEKSLRKIDGMAALVAAVAGSTSNPREPASAYESEDPIFI